MSATLIRVSKSQSSGRMEEVARNLNITMARAEPFEFPAMVRRGGRRSLQFSDLRTSTFCPRIFFSEIDNFVNHNFTLQINV